MRVGVDTGGTFTDVVAADGEVRKLPSTPDDPSRAVRAACDGLDVTTFAHGTTVATNALLQRRLGRSALVTTRGFADVIEIARQVRPSLYDPMADRPRPLVERDLRLEVGGRLDAHGREVEALDPATIPAVPNGVDAVAVCLLHADLDAAHEQLVAKELVARGLDLTCSHEVSPELREYERTVTTVANAVQIWGRLDAHGREVEALDPATIPAVPNGVDAVAVCLLHADLDAAHEQLVAKELVARGLDLTCSHEVSPEFREYERTVTTVANAVLRPVCREYLLGLDGLAREALVMTSEGGLVPAADEAERPAALLLS